MYIDSDCSNYKIENFSCLGDFHLNRTSHLIHEECGVNKRLYIHPADTNSTAIPPDATVRCGPISQTKTIVMSHFSTRLTPKQTERPCSKVPV